MAKRTLPSCIILLGMLIIALASCDTTIKTDEAVISAPVEKKEVVRPSHVYVIDTAQSEITWIGAKMTGRHNGLFNITEGELYMKDSMLSGGNFLIDMLSVRSDDKTIDQASNEKLTKHLRSSDFFDVENHPTAIFEVTEVTRYDSLLHQPDNKAPKSKYSELRIKDPTHRITGNLTIKGETKSVSFPAKVTLKNNLLLAKANFNLDRTKWGLVYRSDQSLGNQTIYPEVNIGINLVAKPAPR
ncbi:polyisoprenoid-binding protein YceI [Pontibacter ummariensis]|uniref:Polyisoprenoid-binding protein YceI n=1 Tax=Pontibacter ummariensis TaxID=1610492 RepID=A0A239L0W4_9BACT|nr:YceI family protein [Pontibacter ummariensis]PRY04624.1 polyisoprenoid-binding protein YceI [Pontibacter ummariensis]SNT23950.1 Polyisoprenoid-binding protein YceI [Pontibacter ummariensis]